MPNTASIPSRAIIALLPGSRKPEIEHNLPMMLHAASLISRRVPGAQFLLAAAPNLRVSEVERMLSLIRREQDQPQGSHAGFNIIESAGGKLREMASHAINSAVPASRWSRARDFCSAANKTAKARKRCRSLAAGARDGFAPRSDSGAGKKSDV